MFSLALRVGPLILTVDLDRVEGADLDDGEDDEPAVLFHGEPDTVVGGHLVR